MFDIDPKKFGIDPQKISDTVNNANLVSARIAWVSLALTYIVKQLATKFRLDLPPGP